MQVLLPSYFHAFQCGKEELVAAVAVNIGDGAADGTPAEHGAVALSFEDETILGSERPVPVPVDVDPVAPLPE